MTYLEIEQSDQRNAAVTGGIAIIIMALASAFSYGLVLESLVIQDDMNATFQNILSSNGLFTAGILGWLIILICDIVVAWSFYIFLKPLHKNLSLLASWLRLTYAGILGVAILNLVIVIILANSTGSFFSTNDLPVLANVFLEAFKMIWSIGLIIFGGHLMMVGYLTFRSKNIPKPISILLLIASFAYMIIHVCYTFLPQLNAFTSVLEVVLTIPMVLGELGFGIWLLFKGGKVPLVRDAGFTKKQMNIQ
ncbi:DUF4386 domain-containing protein [Oceanobacillus sp. CF4.6]|uniref:DUF4386 domain-containing protein n=1 Tax=Oceanobacillus sp. CF4.6 TaxID=3373080 RepID=UPI003EE61CAF